MGLRNCIWPVGISVLMCRPVSPICDIIFFFVLSFLIFVLNSYGMLCAVVSARLKMVKGRRKQLFCEGLNSKAKLPLEDLQRPLGTTENMHMYRPFKHYITHYTKCPSFRISQS